METIHEFQCRSKCPSEHSLVTSRLLRPPQPLIASSYRKRRARAERVITALFDPALSLTIDQALVREEFFAQGTPYTRAEAGEDGKR
ncbi:MAG TPA: hypothetical protein VKB81_04655 [Nitrospira sp.]|nr:hypothetical protein [Nitrospira sp.]